MAMKTHVRKDGGAVIVRLDGRLDFEASVAFRESLMRIEKNAPGGRFVFDFERLQFVGSSGISAFIQALRDFNGRAPARPRYANVRNEFRKIIIAFDETATFDFWETTERALSEPWPSPAPSRGIKALDN